MLTKNELKQLRKEIVLNSLYYSDYCNSLFIKEKTACAFFDSYMEELYNLAADDGFTGDVIDIINKYDNIDNLYNYYLCYEDDPLLKDDFIASHPENNSDGIVIYSVNDNSVIAAFWFLSGLYYKHTKLKKYKLYYDSQCNVYFNYKNRRYYIDEFMRVN